MKSVQRSRDFPWSVPLETMARLNCAVSFANTRGNSRNTFSNKGVVRRSESCFHNLRKEKTEREREKRKFVTTLRQVYIHIYSNKKKLQWREFTREESVNAPIFLLALLVGWENSRRITELPLEEEVEEEE